MKALTKSIKFMGASLFILALAACGKSSDNNNNVAAVQYSYNQNGQCYDITHNVPVQANLCTNGQFTRNQQGQCISIANNQVVDPSYCQAIGQGQYPGQYPGQQGCGTPGYAYPNGQAYAQAFGTNQYPSTCGGGSYAGSTSCTGRTMYEYNGYTAQLIQCYGYSCSGQFLYDLNTRVRVYCQ